MMPKTTFAAFLLLLSACSHSFAQESWYASAGISFSEARDPEVFIPQGPLPADLGNGTAISTGLGYAIVSGLRTEATFSYRTGFEQITGFEGMPTGRARFRSWSAMAAFYADVVPLGRISPYIGAGLGIAGNRLGTIRLTNLDGSPLGTIEGDNQFNFAWQWHAGISVALNERIHIYTGYVSIHGGDYESEDLVRFVDGSTDSGKDTGKFRANEIGAGFRYAF